MILQKVNYEELEREPYAKKKEASILLESFLRSGFDCAEVIDEEHLYYNNNDLNRTINQFLIREEDIGSQVKSFMLNGKVYLKRK